MRRLAPAPLGTEPLATAMLRAARLAPALFGTALLALVTPAPATGQAAAGASFQTYSFDAPDAAGLATIDVLSLPLAVSIPLARSVILDVASSYARGKATGPGGQSVTLSGPTDTDVGLSLGVGVDWLVVTAGATLPTGRGSLSTSESLVAGVMAAELLPFSLRAWGSGWSAGADVAVARQAGAWGVGLAGGYRFAGEYEPIDALPLSYRPGDRLHVRLALDRNVSASGTLSMLVGLQRFSDDRISGVDLFRSGTRLEGVLTYAFALGLRASALLYGGAYHRGNGSVLVPTPALIGATDSPSQQLFTAGTNLRIPAGRRAVWLPGAELRVFRAEDGASQGWMAGVGTTFDVRVAGSTSGRRLVLAPSARFRLGRVIVDEGAETSFTGWEAALTMRLESGR